jgi:putative intracellular protease/amidase
MKKMFSIAFLGVSLLAALTGCGGGTPAGSSGGSDLSADNNMTSFNIVLFDDFETLDAFGPAEVIGSLPNVYNDTFPKVYNLKYYSLNGGIVKSSHNVSVDTLAFAEIDTSGVLLIPGGMGTRTLVNDENFINQLKTLSEKAPYVLTVCTGAGLLAKTGLLNGMRATSSKVAFEWASSNGEGVNWMKKARWVKDGKFYTSSGVSAGIDMVLGFVSETHGLQSAQAIANRIEYVWNSDMNNDPFAIE